MEPVTVLTFNEPEQAEPLKRRLEEAGIPAATYDERKLQRVFLCRESLAGIRLRVDRKDFDRARALLWEWQRSDNALRDAVDHRAWCAQVPQEVPAERRTVRAIAAQTMRRDPVRLLVQPRVVRCALPLLGDVRETHAVRLDVGTRERGVPRAAAQPVPGLEHHGAPTAETQLARRREPRETGADHRDVERLPGAHAFLPTGSG